MKTLETREVISNEGERSGGGEIGTVGECGTLGGGPTSEIEVISGWRGDCKGLGDAGGVGDAGCGGGLEMAIPSETGMVDGEAVTEDKELWIGEEEGEGTRAKEGDETPPCEAGVERKSSYELM